MKNDFKISHYIKHGAALLFFTAIIFAGIYGTSWADDEPMYKAQGFAWGSISDNGDSEEPETGIGYLSFGCESDGSCEQTATSNFPTGYGVRINTNAGDPDEGKFFGYAWSSNYGWVSFYHNDVASCGPNGGLEISGDVQQAINNPNFSQLLKGYARVLNYDSAEWDGCINFSGTAEDNTQYGVKIFRSNQTEDIYLSGQAWGGNVVGWVDLSCSECKIYFTPVKETECLEADDSEVCDPEITSGLALYVGPSTSNPGQIVGNTTYGALTTDFDEPVSVKLVPQAFDNPVDTCTATASGNQGATISGWSGALGSLNPLEPDVISNQFVSTISNYSIGEIITYTIDCLTVESDAPVSAEAFVTIQFPQGSVSISANPNVIDTALDPNASTVLSWTFSNVENTTCEINGFVDFTPADGTDEVSPMTTEFGQTIGFNSWSPDNPGSSNLSQIQFPMVFVLTCDDFANQELSDSTYITTTDIGCTDSMEAAGWCSNDINPIFEEF